MARRIADYVALALISNVDWEEGKDVFSRSFRSNNDFNGDFAELKDHTQERCGFPVTDEMLAEAVRSLADCGLLRVTDDNFSGTFIKIKAGNFAGFIERATAEFDDAKGDDDGLGVIMRPSDFPNAAALMKHELFEDYHELGDKWLKRALEGLKQRLDEDGKLQDSPDEALTPELSDIPASDRLVTIDHNSSEYVELVKATEEASESIRTSNSIDEDKRGWIRVHIAAGLDFIKNHKVLSAVAAALLLKPLLNAYEAVTEEPAKRAIMAAIDAVRALFGI